MAEVIKLEDWKGVVFTKAEQQRLKSTVNQERVLVVNKRWFNPPATVLLAYLVVYLLSLHGEPSVARVVLATFLVLFGSGYSLVAVLFPQEAGLDLVERLGLGASLSLAIGGVSGFVLARSSWGLHLSSFLIVTLLFNLGCCLYIWYRGPDQVLYIPVTRPWSCIEWWNNQSDPSKRMTLVLLALFGVGGGGAIRQAAFTPHLNPPMTEFFLLDSQGLAEEYPTVVQVGDLMVVPYGISNQERDTLLYSVHALIGDEVIASSIPITLAPGDSEYGTLIWRVPGQSVGATKIEFVLYKGTTALRYRVLHLWVNVEVEESLRNSQLTVPL